MNAALALFLADQTSPGGPAGPTGPAPPKDRPVRRERPGRRRRIAGLLAISVTAFTGLIAGLAFADSGDSSSPAREASQADAVSEEPQARPGRAGPGHPVD